MKNILKLFLLLLISFNTHAESINLTCKVEKSSFNVSIVTDVNKKPKVYQNDVDRDSSNELGVSKLTNFSKTGSEIKYDVEYQSYPQNYPNGVSTKSGYSISTFTFNRTSGEITIMGHLFGGLRELSPNADGTTFTRGICEKRSVNKF
jgi:hypothetical protein